MFNIWRSASVKMRVAKTHFASTLVRIIARTQPKYRMKQCRVQYFVKSSINFVVRHQKYLLFGSGNSRLYKCLWFNWKCKLNVIWLFWSEFQLLFLLTRWLLLHFETYVSQKKTVIKTKSEKHTNWFGSDKAESCTLVFDRQLYFEDGAFLYDKPFYGFLCHLARGQRGKLQLMFRKRFKFDTQ